MKQILQGTSLVPGFVLNVLPPGCSPQPLSEVVMMAGTHSKSGTAADKAAKTERQYVVGYRPHRGDGARRR